jgi:hypothetical protein
MHELFSALDRLERTNPDPNHDAGALQLMDQVARDEEGLRALGMRYGRSKSINLVRYLAILLARRAKSPERVSPPTVVFLIDALKESCDAETLLSCLDAVSSTVVSLTDAHTNVADLGSFLNTCVAYSGRQTFLVCSSALEVIGDLSTLGLLDSVFRGQELTRLRNELTRLSNENDGRLKEKLSRVGDV